MGIQLVEVYSRIFLRLRPLLAGLVAATMMAPIGNEASAFSVAQLVDGKNELLEEIFNANSSKLVPLSVMNSIRRNSVPLKLKTAGGARTRDRLRAYSLTVGKSDGRSTVGIATGGNVFSWVSGGVQYLPPQANWFSQYSDDVFQFVLTKRGEGRKRRVGGWQAQNPNFLHQAGSYADRNSPGSKNRYSPLVSSMISANGKFLYMLSWPQQGHVPDRLAAGAIVLTRLSITPKQLLRVENIIFNIGTETYTWMNAPWGGVRPTVFPNLQFSRTGSNVAKRPFFQDGTAILATDARGTALWSSSKGERAFSVVFPQNWRVAGGPPRRLKVRYGIAGARNWRRRDFYVIAANLSPRFEPGDRLYLRYYLGSGTKRGLLNRLTGTTGALVIGKAGTSTVETSTVCAIRKNANKCASEANLLFGLDYRPIFSARPVNGNGISLSNDPYDGSFSAWVAQRNAQPVDFVGFMSQQQFLVLCDVVGFKVSFASSGKWRCRSGP